VTNLNRIATTGYSGANILAAGLGLTSNLQPSDHADPFYRALRRIHKREVLMACEQYSREKGLRLEKRVLP